MYKRVHDLLNEKLHELDARLRSLKEFRRVLVRHLTACEQELREHGQNATCPVVAISKRKTSRVRSGRKKAHGDGKN